MHILFTKDGEREILVNDWFAKAFNYVMCNQYLSFIQKEQVGEGRWDKSNRDFQGFYVQQSTPNMTYEVSFFNDGARMGKIDYDENMPTFCNKSCVVFADRCGRKDVAGLFNSNDANDCYLALEKGFKNVIPISRNSIKLYILKGLVIGFHYIKYKIGHMAPVAGIINGIPWYVNIGDIRRDGVVDEYDAFATKTENMKYFFIGPLDE